MAIDRREALKRVSIVMGGAISTPTLLGIMQGCTATPEPNWKPAFFTQNQALTVMEMSETIMPKTKTPGAKSLGVPSFIEQMVNNVYAEEDRSKFMLGLNAIMTECRNTFGDNFHMISQKERLTFLNTKNDAIKSAKNSWEKPFFWHLKELTLLGYFSTEVGCTQVLQHVLVPGRYDSCAPIEEVGEGRAWSHQFG